MANISLPIKISLAPDALDEIDVAVDNAIIGAFDLAEIVMREEGQAGATRIKTESFGEDTGSGGQLPLAIRSGRALLSIRSETTRLAPFHILTVVGAIDAPADVEQYLTVQEEGKTIRPKNAEKLAWSADAMVTNQDVFGFGFDPFQRLTAREFLEEYHALGYAYVKFTEGAILARPVGGREFDLVFYRADEVTIPARHPIGVQEVPTAERIQKRLTEELG